MEVVLLVLDLIVLQQELMVLLVMSRNLDLLVHLKDLLLPQEVVVEDFHKLEKVVDLVVEEDLHEVLKLLGVVKVINRFNLQHRVMMVEQVVTFLVSGKVAVPAVVLLLQELMDFITLPNQERVVMEELVLH